jgi:hypothetical protein
MDWPFRHSSRADSPGDRVNKTLALPAGSRTFQPTATDLQAQLAASQRRNQNLVAALASQGLQWADPTVPFGPGAPTPAAPINPARDDGTGRAAPRQYEYPQSWNLPGSGQKLVPWRTLRDAGDLDLVRALIEAKKAELIGLEWDVTIGKRALDDAIALQPDTPRSVLEKEMRDKLAPDIAKACKFWEEPDPDNGYAWDVWLGLILEEILVLDALAIYPSQAGGGLHSLWVLDGSTVKPLLDQRGMRPAPPNPAFQQVLYGFPRGDFIADADPEGRIGSGMSADELIYRRQVVRTWTPYGYSAVERALPIIATLAARDAWIRSEYSDGAKPDVFLTPDKDSTIQATEYDQYERALNNLLAGNTQEKRRIKLGPPGSRLDQLEHDAERYKPDYDLYLLKRLAAHFDLPITELGFSEAKGLGSAGFHEGQDDVNERRNLLPWTQRLGNLMTTIGSRYLGLPPELEFQFLGLDDEDEAATDAVVDAQTRGGRATLNEGRDKRGLPRYDFPEADEPFIVAGREIVFIKGALDRQEAKDIQDASQGQLPDGYDPAMGAPATGAVAPPPGAKKAVPAKPAKATPGKAVPAKKAVPVKAVVKSEARDARGRG